MTSTQEFQHKHGARWAAIANGPELPDALLTVGAPLLDEIMRLTPAEIASPSGNAYLARLQGQLLHERALIDLSVIHPDITNDLPPSTYPNPEDEAAEEEAAVNQQQAGGSMRVWAAEIADDIIASTPLEPPPKKRRKRKKKTNG